MKDALRPKKTAARRKADNERAKRWRDRNPGRPDIRRIDKAIVDAMVKNPRLAPIFAGLIKLAVEDLVEDGFDAVEDLVRKRLTIDAPADEPAPVADRPAPIDYAARNAAFEARAQEAFDLRGAPVAPEIPNAKKSHVDAVETPE